LRKGLVAITLGLLCLGARAGDITAYTALEEDDVRVYLAAFNKAKPGIKVNVLRLSTGDLAARMLAEKSNPRHDVIWGWAVTQMVDPRFLEMAEPYKPVGIDKVNPQFKDPDGRWFATTGYFAGFLREYRNPEKEQSADADLLAGSAEPGLQGSDRDAECGELGHRLRAGGEHPADERRREGLAVPEGSRQEHRAVHQVGIATVQGSGDRVNTRSAFRSRFPV
jgi:hypothetical protein